MKQLPAYFSIQSQKDNMVIPWTPAQLSSAAWYDASDPASIVDVGGYVTQWNDKSGNGYHTTQGNGADQPITGTRTLNGLNALDFVSNDCLRSLDAALLSIFAGSPPEFDIFMAYNADSQPGTTWYLRISGGSGAVGLFTNLPNLIGQEITGNYLNITMWDTNPHIINIGHDISKAYIIGDGESYLNEPANTSVVSGPTEFNIGSYRYTNSIWGLAGLMGELLVFDGKLPLSDRQKVEGYLAWKWGTEGNLPPGHPYKTQAPVTSLIGE